MDITCCDLEKAVIGMHSQIVSWIVLWSGACLTRAIARNILLLTLIIDSSDGKKNDANWNIYYHPYLDRPCYDRLRAQAKKLHGLAGALQTWRRSEYSKYIRFCDGGTLARVGKIWRFYAESSEEKQSGLRTTFKTALQRRNKMRGDLSQMTITGLRSVAPIGVEALSELSDLYDYFWKYGSTDMDPETVYRSTFANPMFASPDAAVTVHYGTDPMLGFHISTAYAPLAEPLSFQQSARGSKLQSIVAAAQAEFSAWCDSFRQRASDRLTLRFFVGDAIAFSHTLQCRRITRGATLAHWYRSRHEMEPLTLDEGDYGPGGTAPLSFTVIDTSNLGDHVGALNLLVAISPLLSGDVSASLYTETLARQGRSRQEVVDSLLCGHLPSTSLLLDLFPVEYWTGTSPSSAENDMLDALAHVGGTDSQSGQFFARIKWTRPMRQGAGLSSSPPTQLIRFDEKDLANILYNVYLQMFKGEDLPQMLFDIYSKKIQKVSLPLYNRASFVSFLRLIKGRVDVDWSKAMDLVLQRIEDNTSPLTGGNYIQELHVYMRLLDVHTVDMLENPHNAIGTVASSGSILGWANMPPVVCVTLKVPREKLAAFTSCDATEVGTPPICCRVQSSSVSSLGAWHHAFTAVQMGFGQVSTSGSRNGDDFKTHIAEDSLGWQGQSPLFVSFRAPTWMLLQEFHAATVAFGIQYIPLLIAKHMGRFGPEGIVFQAALTDLNHVYISKDLPNQTGMMAVSGFADEDILRSDVPNPDARTVITANTDTTGKISSLTGRLDIVSEALRSALRGGCSVQTTPLSPCNFTVSVGRVLFRVDFPLPVIESSCKTRVARKSSYVELIAPVVTNPSQMPSSSLTCPLLFDGAGIPTAWSLPYLNLQTFPVLDISKSDTLKWLMTHISMMVSTRERSLRADPSLPSVEGERTRINFKESLFSLFMHFTGLKEKESVFGINNLTGGGVHIIVFVSSLRLDLASRTVILDVAVLPLYEALMPKIRPFLMALTNRGFYNIKVDDAELRLWKQVLPAYVERCRAWPHQNRCEYAATGRVPLSVEKGQASLCSCGNGILPGDFGVDVPRWSSVAKHTVRAAISPLFPCSLVDEVCNSRMAEAARGSEACRVCGRDESEDGSTLQTCSRCHEAKYCSRECQRADWKKHKSQCTTTRT